MSLISSERSELGDILKQPVMRSYQSRIAVVDVNIDRASSIGHILSESAWICLQYMSVREFILDQSTQPSDVIVLGGEVIGKSCNNALRQIRQSEQTRRIPILVVGAAPDYQAVSMMESGADVVEIWPISASVLVARVDALLRRGQVREFTPKHESYGAYIFDVQSGRVWRHDQLVFLTPKEFKLALYMFRHQSLIISVEVLAEWAWKRGDVGDSMRRTVVVHISRIRKKLNLTGIDGYCLSFVARRGYRLLKI